MELKDVKHYDEFFKKTLDFDISSNRFVLFDKNGIPLNYFSIKRIPNYLNLEVIEITKSGYTNYMYCVGFATTHIKLNLVDDSLKNASKLRFGEDEEVLRPKGF